MDEERGVKEREAIHIGNAPEIAAVCFNALLGAKVEYKNYIE